MRAPAARLPTGLAVAMLALAACASGASKSAVDPGLKAGGKAAPLSITVADSSWSDDELHETYSEFASQVAALSNGTMTVKVLYDATLDDPPHPRSDLRVVDQLRAGTFPMAVVGAAVWSAAGVTSLKGLEAPSLVQSDEHMDAVARDESVVARLLSGLEATGVHGLTIFPDQLRHPASFTSPILTPADMKGRQVQVAPGPEVETLYRTLGATIVYLPWADYMAAVEKHTVTAGNYGFIGPPVRSIETGNVTTYAKFITLVANSTFWNGLSDQQRTTLTTAAQRTQDFAITHRLRERDAATKYCAEDGTVVLTDEQALADFRTAFAPLYAELEQDADTKQTIEAIQALTPLTQSPSVAACGAPAPPTIVARGGDLPNGIYRIEFTDGFLQENGFSPGDIQANHGVWTWRFQDGHWSFDQVAENHPMPDHGEGIYQVDGDEVRVQWPDGSVTAPQKWRVESDGGLRFTWNPDGGDRQLATKLPFQRIGDV